MHGVKDRKGEGKGPRGGGLEGVRGREKEEKEEKGTRQRGKARKMVRKREH